MVPPDFGGWGTGAEEAMAFNKDHGCLHSGSCIHTISAIDRNLCPSTCDDLRQAFSCHIRKIQAVPQSSYSL